MNLRRITGIAAFLLVLTLAMRLRAQIITNVTPPLGAHGDLVDVYGNGFGSTHPATFSADFNTVVSTTNPLAVVSDTHIQLVNIPTNATSGYINVYINGVKATSPQQFIVISTNAYATNISPNYGAANTTVIVTGVHFSTGGVTNVMFNGVVSKKTPNTPFLNSDNQITVTVPDGVTSGPLTLMSKFGTSHNFSTVSNVISTATNFFVAPSITSFSPTNGRPYTNVVITGTNFTAASAVTFGSFNAVIYYISNNTTILAVVPTNASTALITVVPPTNTILSSVSSSKSFRMQPTIYAFSPPQGPTNTTITISGAGLDEQSPHPTVTVGGTTVTSFGTISPNALSFNVPATAGSGLISVSTTNGSITSSQIFYMPAVITGFTPTTGSNGTIVKITGNSFTNASAVTFNGIPATSFNVTNNTTIGAVAPSGVTSGIISVTTPFGTTNSTALFYVPPTVTGFAPTHGTAGTTVMMTGTSFTNASAVSFNGTPAASFVVTNNSTLSAVVPAVATSGPITVTAPGGSGQSASAFAIDVPDLAVAISASPNPVFVGSNLTYTIIITNAGAASAFNTTLADSLGNSFTLKSASTTLGTLNTNANPVTGSFGTLNANSGATVTIIGSPTAVGFISNFVAVATDSAELTTTNDTAGVITTVWPLPFLSITNLASNNLVQISWPAVLSSFTLQSSTNLSASAAWVTDTGTKTTSGTNVSVIETNQGDTRLFRLKN